MYPSDYLPTRRALFLAVIGVVLVALAFPPLGIAPLAPLGMALWALAGLEPPYAKQVAALGWLAGFLYTLLSLWWLFWEWGVIPLLVLCVSYGFTYALWLMLVRNLYREGPVWFIFGGAAVWTTLEMGKVYGFWTIPLLLIAQTQTRVPALVQIADLTGQWGVSFIVVAVALWLALLMSGEPKLRRMAFVRATAWLVLGVSFWLGYGLYRMGEAAKADPGEQKIKVALAQELSGELLQWTWDYINEVKDRYLNLVRKELSPDEGVDLIILPEEAIPLTIPYHNPYLAIFPELFQLADDYRAGVVFGTGFSSQPIGTDLSAPKQAREKGIKFYNGVQSIGPGRTVPGQYLKLRPVPFGETMPMGGLLEFIEFPWGSEGYDAGRSLESLPTAKFGLNLGPNICYESLYPYISRGQVQDGAAILVNLSNYTWIRNHLVSLVNAQNDVLRAVETRRYYLRVSTTYYSQVVDPYGRILFRNEDPRSSFVKVIEVEPREDLTLYVRLGDWFGYLNLAVMIWLIFALVLRSRDRRGESWPLFDHRRLLD